MAMTVATAAVEVDSRVMEARETGEPPEAALVRVVLMEACSGVVASKVAGAEVVVELGRVEMEAAGEVAVVTMVRVVVVKEEVAFLVEALVAPTVEEAQTI